jgi:hypothetical protein
VADCDTLLIEYKRRDFLRMLGCGALLALPVRGAERPVRVRLDRAVAAPLKPNLRQEIVGSFRSSATARLRPH